MIFRPGMTWNEKYARFGGWGFWSNKRYEVDMTKWSAGARHFAQFILK